MTYNRLYILSALVFFTLLGVSSAMGQEMGSPSFENYNSDSNREYSATELDPSEPVKQNAQPSTKDSATFQRNVYKPAPVVPKDERKSERQDDDSILSFNFLYYLIQKYKMQDIVD